jgi:hypothetical protein
MIIESSIKVRLGARVEVAQFVYEGGTMIAEQKVYGHILRPATFEEYIQESNDYRAIGRKQKFYYYEVRIESGPKESTGVKI